MDQRLPAVAACRSARFWELLVGVLKHAAACRSMLPRPEFFTWRTLFLISCYTCGPFVAQRCQNWMVAQLSRYLTPFSKLYGSIPRPVKFLPVSSSLLFHRFSFFLVSLFHVNS